MSYIEERPFRERGVALTAALHALVLLGLMAYRPMVESDEAPRAPIRIVLIPDTPIPPTPPIVAEPVSARQPGRPMDSKRPEPKRKPAGAPGGGRPQVVDLSLALLHSDLPDLVSGITLGSGAGDGLGKGKGAGTGTGLAGTGRGFGSGGGGGEPPSDLQIAEWIVKPENMVSRYYPLKAMEKRATGTVMLACYVDEQNRVRRCKILSELPRYLDFGKATLRLSKLFRVKPPVVDGRPRYDLRVRIPVTMEYR